MCSICSSWGYILANTMYAVQKLASCCALTAVVFCMVLTMVVMLGVGIGLGYHYCIVQGKTYKLDLKDMKEKYEAMTESIVLDKGDTIKTSNSTTTKPKYLRMVEETKTKFDINDYITTEAVTSAVTELDIIIEPTMKFRIDNQNLPLLLSKIRSAKKNVTLQLFTT